MFRHAFLTSALCLLGVTTHTQGVGSQLPKGSLFGFQGTDASSLDDFYGRALLIEFFAHW